MWGSASRTAQGVAVVRAGFADRPRTPDGDPDAQRRLAKGMRAGRAPLLREHLRARTRFFDACVLGAIERGVEQIVIVGAGYDDRALRFRSPGVRCFELDHPNTQKDKRRRLAGDANGIVFVAADFARESVAERLAAAGHDAARPTLFTCEGLVMYLDASAIVELLRALASRAAPGSELALSIAVHADELPTAHVVRTANLRRGRSGRREPWLTILPVAAHLDLVHQAGWTELELTDDSELEPGAAPGRSLLVRASLTVGG